MTGTSDNQTTTAVQTPLHLLQVLTRALNEHLADACNQAQADAQQVLDKLDREQQELAEKLEPGEELSERIAALAKTRKDAEQYAFQLESDVRQTLRLAKGLERIDLQVTQSIEKRNSPAAAGTGKRPPARRSRNRRPSAAASAPDSPAKPEAKGPSNDSQQ